MAKPPLLFMYIQSITSKGKAEQAPLARLQNGVTVSYFENEEALFKILGLSLLDTRFFNGSIMDAKFRFRANASEMDIENRLIEILNSSGKIKDSKGKLTFECKVHNQVQTLEGEILDLIVFDQMVGSKGSKLNASVSNLKPGRPISLVELKAGKLYLDAAMTQVLGCGRTIIGRHAGLKALAVVVLNAKSFQFGVLHWESFATPKFKLCRKLYELKGSERVKNCGILQALLVHPAVLREREVDIFPVPYLQNLPYRLENGKSFRLISAIAIGGSTAVYLATDILLKRKRLQRSEVLKRSKKINQAKDIPTSTFESRAEIPEERKTIIKFYRSTEDFDNELQILSFLQRERESFGPRILGANSDLNCILYERVEVAEQNIFHNENFRDLTLKHFPRLLSELEFMHERGIVHQDIRRANVGFRDGEPILMDFGFASALPESPIHDKKKPNIMPLFTNPRPNQGYCGTRETASDRILGLLVENEHADIKVTQHDDLCSVTKLWHLTFPGVSLPAIRSWEGLRQYWWLFVIFEDTKQMTTQEFALKLRYVFESRADCDIGPMSPPDKQRRLDLEKTISTRINISDLLDDHDFSGTE